MFRRITRGDHNKVTEEQISGLRTNALVASTLYNKYTVAWWVLLATAHASAIILQWNALVLQTHVRLWLAWCYPILMKWRKSIYIGYLMYYYTFTPFYQSPTQETHPRWDRKKILKFLFFPICLYFCTWFIM